jgi:hypothetical protein
VTVSEAELPSPWNIRMMSVGMKPVKNMPQTVAAKRSTVETTRVSRRPQMLDMGTQKMLPSPSTRTLN